MSIKCLVICCDNSVTLTDLESDALGEFISGVVKYKGYDLFERVQFYKMDSQMWCNEGCLLFDGTPPINNIATSMCVDQVMYCDVVLTGLDSNEGEVNSLSGPSLEFAKRLVDMAEKNGGTVIINDEFKELIDEYDFRMFC